VRESWILEPRRTKQYLLRLSGSIHPMRKWHMRRWRTLLQYAWRFLSYRPFLRLCISYVPFSHHFSSPNPFLPLLGFCRNNVCSNPPFRNLGDACAVDLDCGGLDFDPVAYNCGRDGKCGGNGAACQATDGTAEGESWYCVSRMFCNSARF
jgi:hypothetical protein